MSLASATVVDLLTLLICATLLGFHGHLRHSHPATLYLGFHFMVVTVRAIAISQGAPTFLNATSDEIARAVTYSDLFLLATTAGWLHAAKRTRPTRQTHVSDTRWIPLSGGYIWGVTILALPVGLYALFTYSFVPGTDASVATAASNYATLPVTWPGLLLLALIYRYGFTLWLLLPMTAYLVLMASQGESRFRLILPAIFLLLIFLDRRGRRWPGVGTCGLLIVLVLLFFPLKSIGQDIRAGQSDLDFVATMRESVAETFTGQSFDQTILDQMSVALTLTDQHDRIFWGQPYASIVTLPVPRTVWPDKPGLADHIKEISTSDRPLGTMGTVTTLPGELYMNFRLPGIALLGYLLARLSGRALDAAYRKKYDHPLRFAYLLLAASLIQVYRDGLLSIPVFVLLYNLPLVLIVLLHWRGLSARLPPKNSLPSTRYGGRASSRQPPTRPRNAEL